MESTSIPVATSKPGRWSATFVTPGQGSSGFWSEDVIKRDGPHALKKGSRCFVTHNRLENGEPDPFSMWGFLAEDARYEEGVGLVGEIEVLPSWRDRVEEVAPHTALSVYVLGDADDDGNITSIMEDQMNGVDLVVFPGRENSGLVEKLYEAAKAGAFVEKTSTASVEDKKPKGLKMEKDVEERFGAIETLLQTLVGSKVQESQAEADAAAVEAEAKARVEAFDVAITAIESAELLPSQKAALRESAKRGEDVAGAIETAKVIAKEALEAAKGEPNETGRLGESLQGVSYKIGAWS